jgi:hypothetical protein
MKNPDVAGVRGDPCYYKYLIDSYHFIAYYDKEFNTDSTFTAR